MKYCIRCGKENVDDADFCGLCGTKFSEGVTATQPVQKARKPSAAWYLLPFFLSIIGGVVGYFAVKGRDRRMARNLLIFGVIMFLLAMFLSALGTH